MSTRYAIATDWTTRLCVVLALCLAVLVLMSIHKGLLVQRSAATVVDDFHTANQYFADRADLSAPATARSELERLSKVLEELNAVGGEDVRLLSDLLPDASALLAAGQTDALLAEQLREVAATLHTSAQSIHQIAATADTTVSEVAVKLDETLTLVKQLNAELSRTTAKLAPIPAQNQFIPAPGGN
ncbi:hypothetical protein [Rhodococcus qingshengii]|uniref:hypothetical protein n=1 Tax=Rhodococcus qingshengii TaxID=334542 RepID=UPI00237CBFC4|nr:hypothetical protein [Rhodococcus qingshengii]WCT06038.1 hypothetical protein PI247_29925 [Rhodococcus qingshengii]